jgi:hypothetical protein
MSEKVTDDGATFNLQTRHLLNTSLHGMNESAYGNNKKTFHSYEGESVNRPQMDIKRKTCDIQTWEKHLFLDISSTNIDTLVPLLYQCIETRSIEVIWLFFSQFCTSISTSSSSAKCLPPRWIFNGPNRWRSLGAKSGQ